MYKEEMDRLGFDEGGFFKKLAALGSFFDTLAAPPQTEYELYSEEADKKYKDKPADREMFDVTTNYLMEEEDRNIKDAELMEELNTIAESWTNAEPEKFIKNFEDNEKMKSSFTQVKMSAPSRIYNDTLEWVADKYNIEYKGIRPRSTKLIDGLIADGKIPAEYRGKAINASMHLDMAGTAVIDNPERRNEFIDMNKVIMQTKEFPIQFITEGPVDSMVDIGNNYLGFRLGEQYIGRKEDFRQAIPDIIVEAVKRDQTGEKFRLGKDVLLYDKSKSKLIPHPIIGVDTPIFTTQEEADAYIGGVAKGTRSAIRGVIQGVARYTGLADIATYFKIMAPPRLGGIGAGPKFYQEPTTWLEEAQNFTSGVGKTVIPGDVQEEGVMVSQEATGLVILGVGIKDAVRLIRHYGPQAVAKIKNYFVKNPESTVDEAVKGVLGKAATRRDVMKGMGTGAAVAGTASILGKTGVALKGAAGAKAVAGVATAKFANQIPVNILKGSTVFKRHWSGSKEQIVGSKMFNEDWTINEKVFPTQGLSTKYPKDPITARGTWGEIDHIAIRDMPKLKPHFEKYGLKPNEITKLDRHVQDEYQMLPENFVRGKATSQHSVTKFDIKGKLLDIDKAFYPKSTGNPAIDRAVEIADILKPRKTRLAQKTPDDKRLRELGYSWHDRLDAIKYMHKNPKDFNKQLNQVAEDLAEEVLQFGRTPDEYLNPALVNKKNLITEKEALKFFEDSKYIGTKDGMEFFEIDGIPVIRKVQEQRGDFAPWDYDDAIRMAEEPQATGYWNYEGEAVSTSDIYMPNIRGLERLRGKKFTDKELQELDDLTLFRYTSKFLPE